MRDVLTRPYVSVEERDRFLAHLVRQSLLIDIVGSLRVCRDPKDDHVLELALNGAATHVVTGDDDLLALNPFRGIPIVRPADFLDIVRADA